MCELEISIDGDLCLIPEECTTLEELLNFIVTKPDQLISEDAMEAVNQSLKESQQDTDDISQTST